MEHHARPRKLQAMGQSFSPNSQYEGQWLRGSAINFLDPDMGGTKAVLEIVQPYEHIHARHIAILNKDGTEDTESDIAQKWTGVIETYRLKDVEGGTELSIDISTREDFVGMFDGGWSEALVKLKEMCEGSGV